MSGFKKIAPLSNFQIEDKFKELKINNFRGAELDFLPENRPAPQRGGGVNTISRGMLVKAMPSVMKASAKVSPRVLREVDRLNENPKKYGGQRRR